MAEYITGNIFVTVGNARQDFSRILLAVESLISSGFLRGSVLMQVGNSSHRPTSCDWIGFLDSEQFEVAMSEACLVICHAGAGTLIHAFRLEKVPVVMPRRRAFGEVVDDHQVELASALEARGRVVVADGAQELEAAVRKAVTRQSLRVNATDGAINTIAGLLRTISAGL